MAKNRAVQCCVPERTLKRTDTVFAPSIYSPLCWYAEAEGGGVKKSEGGRRGEGG